MDAHFDKIFAFGERRDERCDAFIADFFSVPTTSWVIAS
jgi:hypothetical protein